MSAVEGWETSELLSLLQVMKSGGTPNTSQSDYYGGEIPFVTIEDMTATKKYLSNTVKTITEEGLKNSNTWLVPVGSILYSIYATLGVPRINTKPVATNQAIIAMINRQEKIDCNYLYYWLEYIRSSVSNLSSQTTQSNLSSGIVKIFSIDYPIDINEQTKIAEVLSCIDTAIEQTEAMIAKQQRIKTGLMQDLLSKGIDEHGNIRREHTHAFKDSPLGQIPVEWEVLPLGSFVNGITSGSRGWASYYQSEGALFLRIGNLTRQHINMRFDDVAFVQLPENIEGKRTEVQSGDVLISITADLGIIGVIPENFGIAYVNQHIALIRIKSNDLNPRYAGHFLASYCVQKQIESCNESGAKAGLNLPTISSLLLLKPPTKEQEKIVDILDKADEIQVKEINYLNKLKRQKTALMQDLLSGKVRVNQLLNSEKFT